MGVPLVHEIPLCRQALREKDVFNVGGETGSLKEHFSSVC